MVDLRRLRCLRPECPDPHRLTSAGDGTLACGACGDRRAVDDYFRRYGKTTGQWIVGATVLLMFSMVRLPGKMKLAGLAVGVGLIAYAIWRIVWQAKVLKATRKH